MQVSKVLQEIRSLRFSEMLPGKTMIASLVIDYLKESHSSDRNVAIIYVYCNYRATAEQTSDNLLSSLLKQSLQQKSTIPTSIRDSLRAYKQNGTRPSSVNISQILQNSLAAFTRVFVVFDALDELTDQNDVRDKTNEQLRSLHSSVGCNILVTSRHTHNLASEFPESLHIEIRAYSEDVQKYIYGHMSQFPRCAKKSVDLQERIVKSIVEAVDGMYAHTFRLYDIALILILHIYISISTIS